MSEIISKMSSYNIFNYLFSGIIFIVLSKFFLDIEIYIKLDNGDIIVNLFWAYFIGLTISRIGSLIIEPIFKGFIETKDYSEFVKAEKINPKISILSEQNNVYRTLTSLFFVILLLFFIKFGFQYNLKLFIIIFLCVIYSLSYLKQTRYIVKRIDSVLKKGDSNGSS